MSELELLRQLDKAAADLCTHIVPESLKKLSWWPSYWEIIINLRAARLQALLRAVAALQEFRREAA